MGDGANDQSVSRRPGFHEAELMLALQFGRVGEWIGDIDAVAEFAKPGDEIEGAAVAQVGDVFLEGQAENQSSARFVPEPLVQGVGDPFPHVVVSLAARQYD